MSSFYSTFNNNCNSIVESMRSKLLSMQIKTNKAKNFSPTLNELREKRSSRVKRLTGFYDSNVCSMKGQCNWWLDEFKSPSPAATKKFTSKANSFDNSVKLNELLKVERHNIAQLDKSITYINRIVSDSIGFVAMKIRENKFCVFGDLKVILGLHKLVILPYMLKTLSDNGECMDFIRTLIQLIDDGQFYCYVSHKMMERSMKKLHSEHLFIAQRGADDTKPFEILEFYKNWIINIGNELTEDPNDNSDDIAACAEAEKKLNNLLDLIANAEGVSHILQIYELPINVQFKVYDIIRKHGDFLHNPMLLLLPKKGQKFTYQSPIDILQLGKFIRSFEFSMTSQELGYMNDSRFFVFEHCIIYATVVHCGHAFSYENHFWIKDATFSVARNNRIIAELNNFNRGVQVDNTELVAIILEMKKDHSIDEITAEIDMSEHELRKIIDSVEDGKKWRRHSLLSLN